MVNVIKPATEVKEVNFKLLLAGLFLLILAGLVLREYVGWEDPVLIKVIFGGVSILFVTSLTHDLRVFLLALLPALATLVFAVLAVALGNVIFQYLMLSAALIFFLVAIKYGSEEVFLPGAVNFNKIIGSVCIFLLLVVSWAILYEFLELTTCPVPNVDFKPPPEIGINLYSAFSIDNGGSKQLSRPALHQKPRIFAWQCVHNPTRDKMGQ